MLLGLLALLAACQPDADRGRPSTNDSAHADSLARAHQDSVNRAQPGYVIDSILPPEEEMRRFRAAHPGDAPTRFAGGETSRDALVRRFVAAVASADSTALRTMAVTAREFADLYYPDSPYARPPYYQPVGLAWRLVQDPSERGLSKLMRRLGRKPMTYRGHTCEPKPQRDGRVTRYTGCLVHVAGVDAAPVTKRYFGSILERDGQFKFLGYNNNF